MFRNVLIVCLCAALALGMGAFLGCASTGTQRAEKAIVSAEMLQKEYRGLDARIDKTLQTLDSIVAAKGGDLRPPYQGYVTVLGNLESQGKRVVDRSADLRKRAQEYIKGWEEQMADVQNPEILKHAEERRAQAEQNFAGIQDELDRIRQDFRNFRRDLQEIKIVLENDLNPAGVEAIEKFIAKAKKDSGPVKEDIETIVKGLEKVINSLHAGTAEKTK